MRFKYLKFTSIVLTTIFVVSSCGPAKNAKEAVAEEAEAVTTVSFTKAPPSPNFEDASLGLQSLDIVETDLGYGVDFSFTVENYELGAQTRDAGVRGIANSGKGQHIHLILNNGPYSAHYESSFSKEMNEGYYVALAFLSRSYHESVKNPNAYFIDLVKVGESAEELEVDFEAPHLFFSRPKGTYAGTDAEKVMIDFYLLNTTLSPDGNKVRATVNGNPFIIEEWAPYYVEGLPMGENTFKLELLDTEGNLVPGPFNSAERTVTLSE